MKNTIFLIAFMLFSTMSFAHFPVTKTVVEGNEVIEATISNSDAFAGKTQVAALLICFFLGGIGIHSRHTKRGSELRFFDNGFNN